jgi:hypothetical protein
LFVPSEREGRHGENSEWHTNGDNKHNEEYLDSEIGKKHDRNANVRSAFATA